MAKDQRTQEKVVHIKFVGDEIFVRNAYKSPSATSARVNLPKSWEGRRVAVILLKEESNIGVDNAYNR